MSLLFTILGILAAIGLIILLSVGLFVALGVFLVLGGAALIFALVFGNFSFSTMTSGLQDDEALKVPQAFNECLLKESPELCRANFTLWDKKDLNIVVQLAEQTKRDLGLRRASIAFDNIESNNINGHKTVKMSGKNDFEKRSDVIETYVLVSDEKDKDHPIKIQDLTWNY